MEQFKVAREMAKKKKKRSVEERRLSVQFVTALVLIAFGVALTFIALFLPPQGEIDGSVLTALGEFFTMAGSIWGLSSYTRIKLYEIDKGIKRNNDNNEDD